MKCGVVDVGSNTIRLSIYHWERDGSMKLLMNRKVMAGLAGYIQDGVMSDSGILVACRTLAGFRSLLDNFEIQDMYVFGTAPLRNIVNTEDALNAIEEITGFRVEVLSGADEAALSFRGAALGGRMPAGLLADIGGGSTELVACLWVLCPCSPSLWTVSFPPRKSARPLKAPLKVSWNVLKQQV